MHLALIIFSPNYPLHIYLKMFKSVYIKKNASTRQKASDDDTCFGVRHLGSNPGTPTYSQCNLDKVNPSKVPFLSL